MELIWLASLLAVGVGQLLGGWGNQDPTNPQYQQLLDGLVKQQLTAIPNGFTLTSVQTQVVAGLNTRFVLENNGAACEIVYFVQSWTDTHTVTRDTCKAMVSRQSRSGGFREQDPHDPQWAQLLNKLTTNYNLVDLSNANDYKILKVETQVVAGMNYRYTLSVDGSWTNTHQITSDTCGIKVAHTRQLLFGGAKPQDPTDPKWSALLNDLQDKFHLTDMSATNNVKIVHVSTQVVAGTITHFTLDIDGTTCTFDYFSQPWTNTNEVNHDTCGIKVVAHNNRRAGGWRQQDPSQQKWTDLVQKLDSTYKLIDLSATNGFEILAVKTQVVAGMNYDFTLKVNGQTCELVYFEQSWTNTHQITSDSCGVKVTHKRQLLFGGAKPQDPTDPKWMTLLNDLQDKFHLTDMSATNNVKIVHVSTQVVAGTITHFTLDIDGTMCTFDYFSQPWTNTNEVNHDTCGIKAVVHSNRRSGGWRQQDPSQQKWADIVQKLDSSYKLVDLSGVNGLEILAVKTQVVAGMNYDFTLKVNGKICSIVYFEQSWSNTHQITSDTCGVKVTHKRQLLAGGAKPQDPTDPKWSALLNDLQDKFHLTDMSAANNVKIVHVSTQVVAGIITHFTLDIDGTTCTFDYFSQPWTNTNQVNHDTCGIKAVAHGNRRAGGWRQQDPSDQKWADLLLKLTVHYKLIDLSGPTGFQIMAVKTQVVAGMNYDFTLNINGQPCDLVYFEQSWTNTHQITSDTCGVKVANKRQLVAGGAMPQDPTDPKWMTLLNDLQDNFNLTDMSTASNVKIVHVSTQVVAGIITHFTLDIDGTMCTFDYFSQPWTNTRQVNHDTCGIKAVAHTNLLAGGWSSQNPSEQKWADIVQKLDSTYNLIDLSGANGYEIVAVKTQVVSGMNYDFTLRINGKLCDIVYYEQSWTNTRSISSDSCGIKMAHRRQATPTCNLHAELQAVQGSTPVPGGWTPQNPSDQYWVNLLQQLDTKYNLVDLSGMNGIEILGVQTQVVAGENVGFTLRINGRTCEVKLFEQSWTNTRIITCDTCGIKKQLILPTPAIPMTHLSGGGRRHIDSVAATQQCTGAILDRINAMSNSMFRLVDNGINKSSSQSINNALTYHIQIELTESQCMNGRDSMGKTSTTGCAPSPTSPIHSVWEAQCKYSSNGIPVEVSGLNMVSQ